MEQTLETPTAVEPTLPTPDQSTESPVDDSIAAHEAQFSEKARETPPVEEGQPPIDADGQRTERRTSQRARSKEARAEDVPRINQLTKRLREAEAEVQRLKAGTPPAGTTSTEGKSAESGFTEPEPTLDDFLGKSEDPYAAWNRAVARWDRRKDDFEREQKASQEKQQADLKKAETSVSEAQQQILETYGQRVQAFVKTAPDFHEKVMAAAQQHDSVPVLLQQAILEDDNGPAILYHLVTHPDQLDEMLFLADGRAVTETSVAYLRRRLSQLSRSQAAPTGSVVTTPTVTLAPRPPNPVRTGPMKTGDELPGDDGSLADHEKAFGKRRR